MAKYKQLCYRCKKNYILMTRGNRFALCYDCQKQEMEGEITDPAMKKMFDIPEDFYKTNAFLRDIKRDYLRFGQLSDKQIEAFKKVVKQLKDEKKDAKA